MALLLHRIVSPSGLVLICDINQNMLKKGRERLVDKGIIRELDMSKQMVKN